jgi:amidase/aspartyl-tRNA(Asn)/glutamyl-tRNA(Gln) amidotransferase subunit A
VAPSDELAYLTATELAARIRARRLSPLEVLSATCERIEQRNPSLNALVHVAFDQARMAAGAAEWRIARGEAPGPLHGVPTATKDLYGFVPGWPATYGGIPALRDYRPPQRALWTERMQRAGAIVLGKTNSPVLGFRGTTDNPLFGPTRNPFDARFNSGGSSGGAAAAVADGLLAIAHGSDGGGSIRIPASCCGVYGFKGSFGRVPLVGRPNAFSGASPFRFDGVLARSVRDVALAMTVLAAPDARDPLCIAEPLDWHGALENGVRRMRIAYTPDYGAFPVDRRVRAVVADAVRAFEEAGARVEEIDLALAGDQRELSDAWCRMVAPAHVAALDALRAEGFDVTDDLPPQQHHWLAVAERLSVRDMLHDQVLRTQVFDALTAAFATYDLLVGPTLCCLPPLNADDGNTAGPMEIEGVAVDELIGWCPTYLANFTGHPAASVPAGLAEGLPVGMQIIGRRAADADVLAASAMFERLRPWDYAIPAARAVSHA